MKMRQMRSRRFLGRCLFGTALGVSSFASALQAQESAAPAPAVRAAAPTATPTAAPLHGMDVGAPGCALPMTPADPCAPSWCDPIERVPNMFGDFFATTLRARQNTLSTQTLHFTGVGAEGGNFATISVPVTANGPGGPYVLNNAIPINNLNLPNFTLGRNAELTSLLQGNFPGATFVRGGGNFLPDNVEDLRFFYDYLVTTGSSITASLPNPADGGLVGRNNYFENGTPLPHDRVYFFYNHLGNVQGLGESFDVNRYVLGVEKTFLCGRCSIEVRVPFAGTVNSDQTVGQALAVDHAEFGNVGLLFKAAVYRTPNMVATIGLGTSAPTASDTRLLVANTPVIAIENRTWLLQPLAGVAWAPTDRCYAEAGIQFDFDPFGNPVRAVNGTGGLARIGELNAQTYALVNAAAGYWVYQGGTFLVSDVALQGELHWIRSCGSQDTVRTSSVAVSDVGGNFDSLTGTAGVIVRINQRADLSIGASFPLTGDRLYDWSAVAQVNFRF